MIMNLEKDCFSDDMKFGALLKKITLRTPEDYNKLIVILMEFSKDILEMLYNFQTKVSANIK